MKKHILEITYENFSNHIEYYKFKGNKEGPRIFISGGMHGNEINGIYTVKNIIDFLTQNNIEEDLRGEIIVVPCLNPSAFLHNQRYVVEDNRDLNRSFGVSSPTTYSEYHAKKLWDEIFSQCDYGIDFHDSGGNSVLLPHSRIHKTDMGMNSSREMGQLFGTQIILEREGRKGMLAVELFKQLQKNTLTIEIGGAQSIFYEYKDLAIQGVKNLLAYFKMYNFEVKLPDEQYTLLNRFGISLDYSAMIELTVKLGDNVEEGDLIAYAYNPVAFTTEKIISPMTGLVLSRTFDNQIRQNENFISILETDKCKTGECYKDLFILMPHLNIDQIIM